MRRVFALAITSLVVPAAGVAPAATPLVRCGSSIGAVQRGGTDGYRVVLGNVAAPPAFMSQVVRAAPGQGRPWWRKAGLLIRPSGRSVLVTLEPTSQAVASLIWGNAGPAATLRFEACPPGRLWSAYAGGFLIAQKSACVAMRVEEAGRSRVVRFGLGLRCR